MNVALWIVQALLAGMFLFAGGLKTFQYEKAKKQLPWVSEVSPGMVAFIGVSELLGAVGLILPTALDIMPVLTAAAAVGIAAIMIIAFIFHAYRGEYKQTPVNIIILLLAVFVYYGRFIA